MKSSKLSKIKQTQPNIVVTDSSDENEGRIVITKMKWNTRYFKRIRVTDNRI